MVILHSNNKEEHLCIHDVNAVYVNLTKAMSSIIESQPNLHFVHLCANLPHIF